MSLTEQVFAQLPGTPLAGLRQADRLWQGLRQESLPPAAAVISESREPLGQVDWDGVICGGTLGILLGVALVNQGWRVALVERGILRGREQEWNISRRELNNLVSLGLLTEAELGKTIATEYNPARVSFLGGQELWVRDVLNIGVNPVRLLELLKQKFLAAGGHLLEQTAFEGAIVHPDGVMVKAGEGLRTRLLLDAMGHFSPIVRQARGSQRPEAVCLVVGGCAQGFTANESGDLIVSFTPILNQCQYFWEAFPARDGRTTYLFTYLDLHPDRLSLEALFEEYLRLLPEYQGVSLAQLQWQRALFGFFPCYRDSPLQTPWNRILAIGDSSGNQSPLSFGGFGALIRHLERLSHGLGEALQWDALDRSSLALLQPYQPGLSVTWLFQKAMSVAMEQSVAPNQINQLLSAVFAQMAQLGDAVLKPFLQDVVQFSALSQTLLRTQFAHPDLVLQIIPQVGLPALVDWIGHYGNLGCYTALASLDRPLSAWIARLPPNQQYLWHRRLEAWRYGSGQDYHRE